MKSYFFEREKVPRLLSVLQCDDSRIVFHAGKHSFQGFSGNDKLWELKLPLLMGSPCDKKQKINIPEFIPPHTIILVRSGDAALGFHDGNKFLRHKMIHSYMVRKKHGKSQLTYMKKKGKSRGGGPLRLKNAVKFFENIQRKIRLWNVADYSHFILIYCPEQLKNMFFSGAPGLPFSKDDKRIRKIPLDIGKPSMFELKRVHRHALGAELLCFKNKEGKRCLCGSSVSALFSLENEIGGYSGKFWG